MRQTRKKPYIAFHMPAIGGALNPAYCCPYHAAARRAGTALFIITLRRFETDAAARASAVQVRRFHIGSLSNCFCRRVRANFSAFVSAPIPYLRVFRAEITLNQQKSIMEHLLQSRREGVKVCKNGKFVAMSGWPGQQWGGFEEGE